MRVDLLCSRSGPSDEQFCGAAALKMLFSPKCPGSALLLLHYYISSLFLALAASFSATKRWPLISYGFGKVVKWTVLMSSQWMRNFYLHWLDFRWAWLFHPTLILGEEKATKTQGNTSTETLFIKVDDNKMHFDWQSGEEICKAPFKASLKR